MAATHSTPASPLRSAETGNTTRPSGNVIVVSTRPKLATIATLCPSLTSSAVIRLVWLPYPLGHHGALDHQTILSGSTIRPLYHTVDPGICRGPLKESKRILN